MRVFDVLAFDTAKAQAIGYDLFSFDFLRSLRTRARLMRDT
jgi:hypothetical protein